MFFVSAQDGARLHYRDTGSGKPVIFLHGWAASGEFFDRQMPLAAEGLRLIVPDLRGHGMSQDTNRNLTIKLLARDLRALIEHLRLAEFALVGWSMGAMVAWEYLSTFGESGMNRFTIIDMTAKIVTDEDWPFGLAGGYPADRIAQTAHSIRNQWERVSALSASKLFAAKGTPDPASVQQLTGLMRANSPEVLADLWIDMAGKDYRGLLPTLGTVCQFIHGMESRLYTPETFVHLAQLARTTHLVGVADAGHVLHWEQPSAFSAALLSYLA